MQTLYTRIAANVQKACSKKNKKKGVNEEDIDVKILDERNNLVSEDCTCSELFTLNEPLKLIISEQCLDIVLNAPWVINLSLPKSIMVGFPVFPESLETLYTEKELTIYNWYRGKVNNSKGNEISDAHVEWNFIVSSFSYTPKAEDIGLKLKLECIPVNAKLSGPVVESISKNLVEAGPGSCPFETRHMFTPTKLNGKSFRCVSYNILADLYCDSDYTRTVLHPYCPPYALSIDYRKQLIMKELKGYNADIICLQEVDGKIFNKCLKPFLDGDNFNGLFYKKGKTVAEDKRISVVLCGDYNSVPSCGIYQLFTTGLAPSSLEDWKSSHNNQDGKKVHKTSINKYPQVALKLPTNMVNINEAEMGRFSPLRERDITGPVINVFSKRNDSPRIDITSQCDPYANKYDCRGAVSLSSSMQSNVPNPFSGNHTHLNMPGSQWGQGYKYLSDNLHSAHYLTLRNEFRKKNSLTKL
ncbi:unnamed protein product [Danaus chrysippus]|uniref:(African queen) hypothetical protein n=1 Tax=Danaus chrysippus TaxID=151541 RepID=A0A8J2QV23_9NEOP|nr:unnamed protein product [Danaus chrysippus]